MLERQTTREDTLLACDVLGKLCGLRVTRTAVRALTQGMTSCAHVTCTLSTLGARKVVLWRMNWGHERASSGLMSAARARTRFA
jgi:hypothetical protein